MANLLRRLPKSIPVVFVAFVPHNPHSMIDTHCHLTFPQLSSRLDEVLAAARADGVDRMITVGTTPNDAVNARAIAEAHDNVYFTVGVHPHYSANLDNSELPRIGEIAGHEKCVAFGEMGVDYHYDDPPRDVQHRWFNAQLEVVRYTNLKKPIIIHCRKAVDDTLAIIRGSGLPGERFVFHCMTEGPDECRKVLDLGAMISFTGIVTYKNAPEVRESAKLVPLDRVMIETDSPYLSPEPHRKVRPNEPRYVTATARFLAELYGESAGAFVERVDANAERFFHLPT
ncbi:MAG: YchF/TatD family DNA exonuclease [Phycisphaera sp.]|nr:YchF/TatD family DNA exonuclease [Phycisphaera sp.]